MNRGFKGLSSNKPDCSGGEVERGEEIPRGLIVARSDAAELFEPAEEILDQVACLVERPFVERAGRCSILPRRDDGGLSGHSPAAENTPIGIPRVRASRAARGQAPALSAINTSA